MNDRQAGWPVDEAVFLTLDLECDYGTALSENTFQALDHVDELVEVIEGFDVPLTCFVQTEVLEERPEAVESLRSSSVEVRFHPHSHTHGRREAVDVGMEIEVSTDRYREYFGMDPAGYRFPNGNVSEQDYALLADAGYRFDASVFPSWRPGHFDNTDASTAPSYVPAFDLFELPFTVVSERVRVPTALSYCRLLGRPFTSVLSRWPPSAIVFNVHMHDLATPASYERLSPFYKAIYSRNDHGFRLLDNVLDRFRSAGYSFGTLDEAHEALREGISDE